MVLENLFEVMGPTCTMIALCGILAVVGLPAVLSLVNVRPYRRVLQRGR